MQCRLQQQQQHRRPVSLGICCVFINDKADEWIQKYTKIKSELARTENGEREIDGMKRKYTKSNQPNERQVADEMNKNQTKPIQSTSM